VVRSVKGTLKKEKAYAEIQLELSEQDFRFLLKEAKRRKVNIDAVLHHILLAYFKRLKHKPNSDDA
jgi:hypothetical protein